MAIKSHPFGPVELTGEDAKAFAKQVARGPSPAAKALVQRAEALNIDPETGEARISPRSIAKKDVPPAR